jgi:amino acid adenylation domain-containing protein/non-ribosomal peptide synthase protein (TIGR01720 family)
MNIPVNNSLEGRRQSFILDDELQKRISHFIKQKRITWNVFFIGLLQIYQYKKTGQNISSTGIPFWGRSGKQERMTFGTFTNTMPFCYRLDANETIDEFYAALTKKLKAAYENQCYPVDLLAQKVQVGKREGLLYHTCINYYNTSLTRTLGGFSLENSEFHRGCQEQPLQVVIRHWDSNKVQLDFDYQVALYTDKQIQDMYEQWVLLIEQITADPLKQISSLSLVSDEDKQKFISITINEMKEPAASWIHCLNESIFNKPDVVAVTQDERSWTYAQFHDELTQLITYYKESGIQKGNIVMAALPHEMKSVAAIYAIILSGAVYLPVSLDWPIERIKEIQQDCQAQFLVSDSISLQDICTLPLKYISKEIMPQTQFTIPDPEDVAYIIYTSGSTGKPKGAMIRHRSLNCYLQWASDTYSKIQHEVHALFSAFTFDFTITALFVPMMNGGEIRIYPSSAEQPNVFGNILCENRVTILKITPSHIGLIQSINYQNHSIHTFIIGGEDLKTQSCQMLLENFETAPRIYNEYGPTEATVGCIVHEYDPQADKDVSVPIGKPIAGAQALIFDKDGNLLPYDTKAELILGGEGLTCGYCGSSGHPEKFIQNTLLPGETLYRTGDLAYINEQGIYIYCGRIDDELKIRGYRINPSELECKAMESEMVLEAAVKAVTIQDSTNLFLYVIGTDCYQEKPFYDWLAQRLPGYMMPRGIVKLESLPLTAHGKVDKSKLPEWKPSQDDSSSMSQTIEEELLFNICNELLPDEVNITADSNFYALGGDSIKAIQISSRILEHGYELKVPDILITPVFREMAKCIIKKQESTEIETISDEPFDGLPIIQWFFNQDFAEPGQYNQSVVLRLKHNIDIRQLKKALSTIVAHHDSLRINVTPKENKLFYNPAHLEQPIKISEIETKRDGWENIESEIRDASCAKFNLENDLLFRVYLIHAKEEQYLFFIFHHLIIDGVSWQIFLHDLNLLIDKEETSDNLSLPNKTTPYAQFANEYYIQNIRFPFYPHQMGEICGNRIILKEILSNEIVRSLMGKANIPYGTKPHELFVMSLAITLVDYEQSSNEKTIFEIESHGRDALPNLDVSRTIGWFTKIYPIIVVIPDESLSKQIVDIKEQLRRFEKNKYKNLVTKQSIPNEVRYRRIRINYMGELIEAENRHWTLINPGGDNDISPNNKLSCDMDINLFLFKGNLHVVASFHPEWNRKGPEIFSRCLKQLELIIMHCMKTKERIYTPSDYELVDLRQEELDALLNEL